MPNSPKQSDSRPLHSNENESTPTTIISYDETLDKTRVSFTEHAASRPPIFFPGNPCDFGTFLSGELKAAFDHIHAVSHDNAMLYVESCNPVYALQSAVHSLRHAIPVCRPVAHWLGWNMEDYAAIHRGIQAPPPRGAVSLDRMLGFIQSGGPGTVWKRKDDYQSDRLLAYSIVMRLVASELSEYECTNELEIETGKNAHHLRAVLQRFRKKVPEWRKGLEIIKDCLRQKYEERSDKSFKDLVTEKYGAKHYEQVKIVGERLARDIERARTSAEINIRETMKRRIKKRDKKRA